MRYALIGVRILLTLSFISAGAAKLAGVEMMVETFDALGFGQWFRYVTGVIEVSAAVLLWLPRLAALGAGLLVCTMICAVVAHLAILGPSPVPALVLGLLSAFVVYGFRDQVPGVSESASD